MIVPQQATDVAGVDIDDVVVEDVAEPTPPSHTPTAQPLPPSHELPSTSQITPTLPPSTIVHSELKFKDKGKWIMDDMIEQVKRKEKEDNAVLRYQALKRKPQTEAHARKNMMVYLYNMAGFKMDFFKGMSYDAIRPIFKNYFNSNVAFLEKTKEQLKEEESRALKRKTERLEEKAVKKQKLNEEEDASKQGGIIAYLDADKDVTLEEVDKYDEDDESEPTNLKEVVEVVNTAKLMTKVVAAATATITAVTTTASTITSALSAAKRRKGIVIRDPEETATPSTIVHSELKFKDKGKWIMDDMIEQVKRKEKEDNAVLRYQALKRKPQTEAHARKNMMVYLYNMAGFKMDFFKGMSYDAIRLIFENYFNSNVDFLEKTKEQLKEEESRALKRKTERSEEKAVKKQKLNEEVEDLKKHLQIVPNDDDDVYTEATSLALKVPVVNYEIHTANNKPYYKIIRADGTHQLFLSFLSLLRNFDREDLEVLWQLVKERFASLICV
nr:hypothetical protein [Tanacetum cinerariifolium]